jgi:hypothetical protein
MTRSLLLVRVSAKNKGKESQGTSGEVGTTILVRRDIRLEIKERPVRVTVVGQLGLVNSSNSNSLSASASAGRGRGTVEFVGDFR